MRAAAADWAATAPPQVLLTAKLSSLVQLAGRGLDG